MNQLATTVAAVMLTSLGCVQMMGDLTHSKVLKALGAASQASPAPKVFTAHEGFETFSSCRALITAETPTVRPCLMALCYRLIR